MKNWKIPKCPQNRVRLNNLWKQCSVSEYKLMWKVSEK